MTATQLKTTLSEIADKLPKSKLESVIAYANLLFSKKDFWLDIGDEELKGIEAGEKDFEEGRMLTLNESLVKYEKKYKRKKK